MSFGKNDLLLTSKGFFTFETLSQKEDVVLITDSGFLSVKIMVNEIMSPIRSVIFSDGSSIECGLGQFFLIEKGGELDRMLPKDIIRTLGGEAPIKLRGLRVGTLMECGIPKLLNFQEPFPFPFIHGYCCSSGFLVENKGEKDFILDSPPPEILQHSDIIKGKDSISIPNVIKNIVAPINSSINIKIDWLNGLFLNKLYVDDATHLLCYQSNNFGFLKEVKLLLFTLGAESSIEHSSEIIRDNGTGIIIISKLLFYPTEYNKLVNLGLSLPPLPSFGNNGKKSIKCITDSYNLAITYRIEKNQQTDNINVCCINGISVPC